MRFTISRKEKVKQFNDIIKKMQKVCPEVNFVFDTDGLYAQGMNSSHVIIFELKLKNDWFDEYECSRTSIMGVNCSILATVHNCIIEGQKIKWSYYHDSTEELLVYFEGSGFDKEFEVKLMDIDTEQLEIPEIDYNVDMSINSQDWSKIMSQMNTFGEKTRISLGTDEEQNIYIKTNGDIGKMQVTIKQEQVDEFAIEEGEKIEIEFSTKFLLLMSEFSSLNAISNLHFSSNYPMKMCLSLDHWMEEDDEKEEINSYIKFYLAPCVGDDDEIDDMEV